MDVSKCTVTGLDDEHEFFTLPITFGITAKSNRGVLMGRGMLSLLYWAYDSRWRKICDTNKRTKQNHCSF